MRAINKMLSALILWAACSMAFAASVNINTADAETLANALKGVGPAKAQAIVEYREQNGVFTTVEDLLSVKGIGDKLLEDNMERISVKSE